MRRIRCDLSLLRRWTLFGPLLILMMLLATRPTVAAASSRFPWRQYQGTTLHVLLSQSHWQQVIAQRLPEFEELTGIKLATEVYPQGQLWDLLETGLKEPGRVDVFMTLPALDGLRYLRTGGIQSVKEYLQNPSLTAPDYNWEDFFPSARAAMEIEGAILGPPVMAEHLAIFYRKDLFKQYQVPVPRTLDELEAAARQLHMKPMGPGGAPGFGVVSRGKGANVTSLYAGYLHAMGGTWLDEAHRSTINKTQSLQALERLGRLLHNYAPPNISDFDWQEASSLFMDGKAAMYLEGSSVFPLIEHSGKSRVAGQVGYAVFPAGPGGPGTTIAVRGLAIAKQSSNPGAAWLFLQWASSLDMVRKALVGDILVARRSAWKDKYYWDGIPPDLVESFQEAARIGAPSWAPPVVAVASARETVGKAITAAIRGEDYRAAADVAAQRLREILKTTEGY
jgi:multiple sugar transport system substrate-binding protein